jgi:hypothetical protein
MVEKPAAMLNSLQWDETVYIAAFSKIQQNRIQQNRFCANNNAKTSWLNTGNNYWNTQVDFRERYLY